MSRIRSDFPVILWIVILAFALMSVVGANASGVSSPAIVAPDPASGTDSRNAPDCLADDAGSPFIPVDSWVYPAMLRLSSLGFLDHVFLNMRPWTRASIGHMLQDVNFHLEKVSADQPSSGSEEAERIFDSLVDEIHYDRRNNCLIDDGNTSFESAYSAVRAMSGTPLHDSYHLGSTIINDYDRPYAHGFNNYTGLSAYASRGRYLLYFRGEFQGAPSATGYSAALAEELSNIDEINFINPVTGLPYYQATIPLGPISATARLRLLEAYVGATVFNHIVSFGKVDEWMSPAQGGSMAYSNNAENIYAFRINRVEPLRIPGLSKITGPFRYEFLVGPLHGHTEIAPTATSWVNPGDPWMHAEKISFRPTANLEFGFERSVIWGGKGHAPITLHTFLRSFFSTSAPTPAVKNSPADPGARFSAFDFTYRLPFLRNWLTLYTDSEVHDDISAIDAPRRAALRPGLYLSHVPGLPKLDVRAEAVSTDPPIKPSHGGRFMYWEVIQRQGYTNNGALIGDWVGREDKGGQGWITYHLSGNEWMQIGIRNQKAAKDFIPGGTTINDIDFQIVKRLRKDLELNGQFTFEHWKAPIYLSGQQTVTSTTIQLTWYPKHELHF
ncbi:MAG: capsule assembly Wzi family protein [Terracidiphilus sp.]